MIEVYGTSTSLKSLETARRRRRWMFKIIFHNRLNRFRCQMSRAQSKVHCNLRPPDVVPVVLGFNYAARNASAYKFNNSTNSADPRCTSVCIKRQHNRTIQEQLTCPTKSSSSSSSSRFNSDTVHIKLRKINRHTYNKCRLYMQ